MKRCFKCGIEKPLVDFYAHKMMADGRLNKCKECTKSDVKQRRSDNLDAVKAYDRSRNDSPHRVAARAAYALTDEGKAAMARGKRKYILSNPGKTKARNAVSNGIRDGKITPWPTCAIPSCESAPEAHHADYSRPLDVVWLCDRHHKDAHKLGREINRSAAS